MAMDNQPARLLWDAGGLWSVMTWQACRNLGLPLKPISAAQVAQGGLRGAGLLVVPGGWPSLKKQALGEAGCDQVRSFVEAGGRYLGFCGGAGLALAVSDGMGLVKLGRIPRAQRLPAASGPMWVEATTEGGGHAFWRGLSGPLRLNVWWPGQFAATDEAPVTVLARYKEPAPGFCSADLKMDEQSQDDWAGLEEEYGMRLDPGLLRGEPAVIQALMGRGEAVLSYPHLDTPGSADGAQCLGNLWRHWLGVEPGPAFPGLSSRLPAAEDLAGRAEELWREGLSLGLWQKRHPAMPLWRRGARGLEIWSLVALCRALAGAARQEHESLVARLACELEPVWREGPAALEAQAALLANDRPHPAGLTVLQRWFPAPRRTGGELGSALISLEKALGRILAE